MVSVECLRGHYASEWPLCFCHPAAVPNHDAESLRTSHSCYELMHWCLFHAHFVRFFTFCRVSLAIHALRLLRMGISR